MLVLKKFTIDEKADNFLTIVGRKPGFVAFLLNLIGLDPTTELTCNHKEALFKKSSLKGQINECVPIPAITCVDTEYTKPFHLFYLAAISLVLGIVGWIYMSMEYMEGGIWLFAACAVFAAISLIIYSLKKEMSFRFFNGGDKPVATIVAKSSVVEGVKVDFDKFVEAAEILNGVVCNSRANKSGGQTNVYSQSAARQPASPSVAQPAPQVQTPAQPQVQTPPPPPPPPQPQAAVTMRMQAVGVNTTSTTYGDESGYSYQQPKSKTPIIIGIAAAVVLIAGGVGAYFMMSPNATNIFETGKLHFDAGNHEEAVNYLTQAINKNSRDANFFNYRGRAHFELKNNDAALADFTEAARLAPSVADHHFRMGEAFMAMRNHASAVAAYSEAIQIEPNNDEYHFRRGDANNANNALAASLDDYSQAIRINPNDARYWNNRGGTHRQMENYTAAIIDYNEAIRLNPSDARYRNNRGVTHHLARNQPAAIADYTSAIQLAPDNARYYNNRGQVHNLMRNYLEAIEDFRMASELAPDNNQYRRDLEQAQERWMRQQQQQMRQQGGWGW